MLYINFQAPDGKQYKIDVSNMPITYVCPHCGEETIVVIDSSDPRICTNCREERARQKAEEMDRRLYSQLANYLNKKLHYDLTPDEAKQLITDRDANISSEEELIDQIKRIKGLDYKPQVRRKPRRKQKSVQFQSPLNPKITVIKPRKKCGDMST